MAPGGYGARNDTYKRATDEVRGETGNANTANSAVVPAAPTPLANEAKPVAPPGPPKPAEEPKSKTDEAVYKKTKDDENSKDEKPASRGTPMETKSNKEALKDNPADPAKAGADHRASEAPKAAAPAGDDKKDGAKQQTPAGPLLFAQLPDGGPGNRLAKTDAKPEARKLAQPVVRPPTVQLGPMRPVWLKAPSGERELVLVRAARLETKTVFQGVLLDWPRLQAVLTEEVRPQLPDAKLEPVTDTAEPSERRMTALPAVLDPGPEPTPPPTGWTPLRIGLTLGWVAALLALAAVGFVGWTLIDLSERRIRFVSAVTHELRTPLTALRLSTDLLASGMIADEDHQKQYLRTMGHESERLNTLIENVLDFAKLEKRTVQAHRVPVPIIDLLESVKTTWADRLAGEGRELVVLSTLPPEQIVSTDARIAAQILGNLIDNARKYTREAEEKRIWLWARPGGPNRVVLEVEDRGPGVAASECGSIFRPFRRGQNVSATGGAGLGLALAKQWADLLGGAIAYRPADGGVGACFRLELPAA
jgi:signal transduction histidine kinase